MLRFLPPDSIKRTLSPERFILIFHINNGTLAFVSSKKGVSKPYAYGSQLKRLGKS